MIEENEYKKEMDIEFSSYKKPLKWLLGMAGVLLSCTNIIIAIIIFFTISSALTEFESSVTGSFDSFETELNNTENALDSAAKGVDNLTDAMEQIEAINSVSSVFGINISINTENFNLLSAELRKMKEDITPIKKDMNKIKKQSNKLVDSVRLSVMLFCIIIILSSLVLAFYCVGMFI